MTLDEFIVDALAREQELLLEAVQDLTPEELGWRAGPEANPIGWILWHMIRVEDMWFQFFVQRKTEIWERDGWNETFGLPTRDNGFGHTQEQVADFPVLDLAALLRYGQAVRQATLEYLETLGPEDYAVVPQGAASGNVGGGYFPPDHRRGVPAPGPHCLPEGIATQRIGVK